MVALSLRTHSMPQDDSYVSANEKRIDKTFSVQPGGKLVIKADEGSISVTGSQRNEVVVHVRARGTESRLDKLDVSIEQSGNTVKAISQYKHRFMNWFGDDNIDIARGLGKHVVVIGFSGGGALGTWASAARPDVSQTILISPVLHPLGIPEWADRPLVRALRLSPVDVYKWWNAEKKADNLEGYNYPRLSLKGLAGFLSLSHWVDAKAARGPVARMPILLVRNDGDQRLDSAYNERYVQRMTAPQMLSIYRIPKSAGLLHNFVSPESFSESHDHIREAYGYLSDVLGVPLPDPLTPR